MWVRGARGAGRVASGRRDGGLRRMGGPATAHLLRKPVNEEREAFIPVHVVAVSPCLLEAGGPDLSLGETEDELGLLGAVEPTKVLR